MRNPMYPTNRNVFRSDGSMHVEHQVGNMRVDLTDGSVTHILSGPGNTKTVVRPDGSIGTEHTYGSMRVNLDNGTTDYLL